VQRKSLRGGDEKMKKREHVGSSFDDFLKEEGTYEETQAVAIKRVLAWKIEQDMKKKRIVKARMARLMHTSRSQLDRLLDPQNPSVTLSTLARAGHVLGREVRLELV
jgi:antitoxin HicB